MQPKTLGDFIRGFFVIVRNNDQEDDFMRLPELVTKATHPAMTIKRKQNIIRSILLNMPVNLPCSRGFVPLCHDLES